MYKIYGLADLLNLITYFNASTGHSILPESKQLGALFFSSEGARPRLAFRPNEWQDINKYIIARQTKMLPRELIGKFRYECFYKQYALYFIILAVFLIGIAFMIIRLWKHTR